ncbi:MAG: mannitol dehydrogenase family protein [Oscillospiraceae bacterium]|jgi:fructuronate reductase|nr:mannitol dehydrogenase family protein [Oscillospiraceae bacterium]
MNRAQLIENTARAPIWLHFGAGNLFRAFPAALMQTLIENGLSDRGIIVAAAHDFEPIDRIYLPNDCVSTLVTLKSDGTTSTREIASVTEALQLDRDVARLREIFAAPSLQLVSFTITEKGYAQAELWHNIAELIRHRSKLCKTKIAFLSLDNCANNGDMLRESVLRGADGDEYLCEYIRNNIHFPHTMIDKITPSPDPKIAQKLGAEIIVTAHGGRHASFVNAEETQYLIVEDDFPNGRPPLEHGGDGVFFTDRETVEKAERMKVGALLNPLHTALAIFGCLFGYTRVCDASSDLEIAKLLRRIGYAEALPVAPNPVVISPEQFLDTFLNVRLPNPNIPDTPQRIASDTSQKLKPRFGEMLRAYANDTERLVGVPLAIAGWLRYLRGVRDDGEPFELSPDPRLSELIGAPISQILSDASIFGVNIYTSQLGRCIELYYHEMSAETGSVRETLRRYLND